MAHITPVPVHLSGMALIRQRCLFVQTRRCSKPRADGATNRWCPKRSRSAPRPPNRTTKRRSAPNSVSRSTAGQTSNGTRRATGAGISGTRSSTAWTSKTVTISYNSAGESNTGTVPSALHAHTAPIASTVKPFFACGCRCARDGSRVYREPWDFNGRMIPLLLVNRKKY